MSWLPEETRHVHDFKTVEWTIEWLYCECGASYDLRLPPLGGTDLALGYLAAVAVGAMTILVAIFVVVAVAAFVGGGG